MAKRRRLEILAAVLNSAVGGTKKTRIMYEANLSYNILAKYLEETINLGFLQPENRSYVTTETGLKFLEEFARFSSKYSRLGKELEESRTDWRALEQMCEINGNCNSTFNDSRLLQPLNNNQKYTAKQP